MASNGEAEQLTQVSIPTVDMVAVGMDSPIGKDFGNLDEEEPESSCELLSRKRSRPLVQTHLGTPLETNTLTSIHFDEGVLAGGAFSNNGIQTRNLNTKFRMN